MPVQKAACEALEYNNGTHLVKTGTLVTINNEIENSAIRNVRFSNLIIKAFLFIYIRTQRRDNES